MNEEEEDLIIRLPYVSSIRDDDADVKAITRDEIDAMLDSLIDIHLPSTDDYKRVAMGLALIKSKRRTMGENVETGWGFMTDVDDDDTVLESLKKWMTNSVITAIDARGIEDPKTWERIEDDVKIAVAQTYFAYVIIISVGLYIENTRHELASAYSLNKSSNAVSIISAKISTAAHEYCKAFLFAKSFVRATTDSIVARMNDATKINTYFTFLDSVMGGVGGPDSNAEDFRSGLTNAFNGLLSVPLSKNYIQPPLDAEKEKVLSSVLEHYNISNENDSLRLRQPPISSSSTNDFEGNDGMSHIRSNIIESDTTISSVMSPSYRPGGDVDSSDVSSSPLSLLYLSMNTKMTILFMESMKVMFVTTVGGNEVTAENAKVFRYRTSELDDRKFEYTVENGSAWRKRGRSEDFAKLRLVHHAIWFASSGTTDLSKLKSSTRFFPYVASFLYDSQTKRQRTSGWDYVHVGLDTVTAPLKYFYACKARTKIVSALILLIGTGALDESVPMMSTVSRTMRDATGNALMGTFNVVASSFGKTKDDTTSSVVSSSDMDYSIPFALMTNESVSAVFYNNNATRLQLETFYRYFFMYAPDPITGEFGRRRIDPTMPRELVGVLNHTGITGNDNAIHLAIMKKLIEHKIHNDNKRAEMYKFHEYAKTFESRGEIWYGNMKKHAWAMGLDNATMMQIAEFGEIVQAMREKLNENVDLLNRDFFKVMYEDFHEKLNPYFASFFLTAPRRIAPLTLLYSLSDFQTAVEKMLMKGGDNERKKRYHLMIALVLCAEAFVETTVGVTDSEGWGGFVFAAGWAYRMKSMIASSPKWKRASQRYASLVDSDAFIAIHLMATTMYTMIVGTETIYGKSLGPTYGDASTDRLIASTNVVLAWYVTVIVMEIRNRNRIDVTNAAIEIATSNSAVNVIEDLMSKTNLGNNPYAIQKRNESSEKLNSLMKDASSDVLKALKGPSRLPPPPPSTPPSNEASSRLNELFVWIRETYDIVSQYGNEVENAITTTTKPAVVLSIQDTKKRPPLQIRDIEEEEEEEESSPLLVDVMTPDQIDNVNDAILKKYGPALMKIEPIHLNRLQLLVHNAMYARELMMPKSTKAEERQSLVKSIKNYEKGIEFIVGEYKKTTGDDEEEEPKGRGRKKRSTSPPVRGRRNSISSVPPTTVPTTTRGGRRRDLSKSPSSNKPKNNKR